MGGPGCLEADAEGAGGPGAAPERDLVEAAPCFEGGFEVGTDDVGEQVEDLQDIRLAGAVRTHEHCQGAQRDGDVPQAAEVLDMQFA